MKVLFRMKDARRFRLLTLPGIAVAFAAGLIAFLIVYSQVSVPIPGMGVVTDPREVAVIFGSIISGPLGAVVVGCLAGAAVPDGNALASMFSHSVAGVAIALVYRVLAKQLKKSTFRFVLLWAVSVAGYFYCILVPVFILAHNLYQTETFVFAATYAGIARGVLGEAAATLIVTTLIMLILPRRYRLPMWGN